MVAHGTELREQGASVDGRASARANRDEQAPIVSAVGDDEVLSAWGEMVGTVAVVAAGKDIHVRGVGAGKLFVHMNAIVNDGGVRRGRFGGDVFRACDRAEKDDVVGLESRANARGSFGAHAGPGRKWSDEKEKKKSQEFMRGHHQYPTLRGGGKSRRKEKKTGKVYCGPTGVMIERSRRDVCNFVATRKMVVGDFGQDTTRVSFRAL
jgi:hypothetical protein